MASYLSQFRELHDELMSDTSGEVAPLLARWAAANSAILEPYRHFRQLNGPSNNYPVEREELHSLYALSRICDVTLLPFQAGEVWFDLSRNQFEEFWQTLGIEAREPREYHPFWCEIVQCENVEDIDAPPTVDEMLWSALTWGEMLICRAGVRVRAGRNWLDAGVAASSPLYFAHRRGYRETHDLSHGWGGNSQWRTAFRRDYFCNGFYVFNADGAPDGDKPPWVQTLSGHEWAQLGERQFFASDFYRWEPGEIGSSFAERESLLVNRSLICGDSTDAEFWPWPDTAIWRQSAPLRTKVLN